MITFMFKSFLVELEDLKDNNLISDEYFEKRRKWILDTSGNMFREFEDHLNKFKIEYKGNNKIYENER